MSAKVRIVLVEPREAGNVGAAARAMKNFGFREMTLVGELPTLAPVAEWWACGAEDVIAAATRVERLDDALAIAHRTIATTSARGRGDLPQITPPAARDLFREMPDDQTLAVVFGREDRGLTTREVALCQHTAVVETARDFPTMNLAQSVAVFCYELSGASEVVAAARDLAPAELIERLHEKARAILLESGFLHANNPDRIYDDLRAIVGRAGLDTREATIVLGILSQIAWWKDR
ncbi:MAG TPA: TrmJ/YjtD family RNA methyltransferase [Thermoanaerobaculia bacterium]